MKRRQSGSAMIVVMCVMVVVVALSLVLLLTASILVTNATRSNTKEQCRINAISVSNVLIEEITSLEYDDTDGSARPTEHAEGKDDTLKGKLNTVATSAWYAYKPDAGDLEKLETNEKDRFTYELKTEGLPGKTVVELYWKDETDGELKELNKKDPQEAADKFQSVLLYVVVTSTVGQESSTIISTFNPNTPVMNGDGTWKSWNWQYSGHEWERGNS